MRSLLTGLVPVFLCACAMTPQQCRSIGVDVPDGAVPTGRIVEEHIADLETVHEMCRRPTRGCARRVGLDDWEIWAVDDNLLRAHEACHAIYQRIGHYAKFE